MLNTEHRVEEPSGSSTRVCTMCMEEKSVAEFYRSRHGTPMRRCKACHLEHGNERRRNEDPEARLRRSRVSALAKFGLSERQYDWLVDEQGGVCAICGTRPTNKMSGFLFVDHDHTTGMVRGLLCHGCNAGIGLFREEAKRFLSAVDYLERAPLVIPDLPKLCACGQPTRSPRAKMCAECDKVQRREVGRLNMAEQRRRKRIAERGADISHAERDKTLCPEGHPYDEVNTYVEITKTGKTKRHCLTCRRETMRRWYEANRQKKPDVVP